VMVDHAAVDFT